jgi:hypothetical protein
VTNSEADIKVPFIDDKYWYYRFSVDEWRRWEHDGFGAANMLLVQANEQFAAMHRKNDMSLRMDEFEISHSAALLDAVVRGERKR